MNLRLNCHEIVEEEKITSFEVNPFDKRHKKIWESVSKERRVAASRVAAVHVHISVTEKEAVKVLNYCREDVMNELISIGDHSQFERINAYRIMAETNGIPPVLANFSELRKYIISKGGESSVWDLVRYKPSTKTVEFRMFGTTKKIGEILQYVEACQVVLNMANISGC